jgi:pimeloyl-ACP methyl ester carboxylesterase
VETQDFLTLSTIVEGELGHPVLLVHDLNASLHDWEALIPSLVLSGHVVHACDLFGHGQSPHPEDARQYYAQMHLTSIRRWIDSLCLTRAPILIGHGFGAYLCLRYTLGHPYRVFRLVLINPLIMPEQISSVVMGLDKYPLLERLAERFAPDWTARKMLGIHKGCPTALEQRILTDALHSSPFNRRVLPTIADLTPEFPDLPTRSLFICGEADPLLDMSLVTPLVEDMVDIQTVSMPNVHHRPHLEASEDTNKKIVSFLLGI